MIKVRKFRAGKEARLEVIDRFYRDQGLNSTTLLSVVTNREMESIKGLPRGLAYARDKPVIREFAEANAAYAEIAHISALPAAPEAPQYSASRKLWRL